MTKLITRSNPAIRAALLIGGLLVLGAAGPSQVRAEAANPYKKPDDSWITISGTVESVERDAFKLDYGEGFVTVEMDDGDRDADAYKLLAGDEVTVSGVIDDDFFEKTTIEAASVYVAALGTTFYSSTIDDESSRAMAYWEPAPDKTYSTTIKGTVTAVTEESFLLSSGTRRILVDIGDMPYNPLDDEGYQRIGIGDKVSVSGEAENALFDSRVLMARSVIKMDDRALFEDGGP